MRRGAERGGAVRTWAELGEALRHLRGGAGTKAGRRGAALGSVGSGVRRVGSGLAELCRGVPGQGTAGALLLYPVR